MDTVQKILIPDEVNMVHVFKISKMNRIFDVKRYFSYSEAWKYVKKISKEEDLSIEDIYIKSSYTFFKSLEQR